MRVYAVKINGSQLIIPAERVRSDDSLLTQALRTHFPYTKGLKREKILREAKINELKVIGGVAKAGLRSFELA